MRSSFQLGDWLVEPQLNRVSGLSGVVQLEPRVMDLLVFLARHPDEVLSREILIDGVWKTQFVGEAVLRNTVAALRRAGVRVADISADFRLRDQAVYEEWYQPHSSAEFIQEAVYGLPEVYRAWGAESDAPQFVNGCASPGEAGDVEWAESCWTAFRKYVR